MRSFSTHGVIATVLVACILKPHGCQGQQIDTNSEAISAASTFLRMIGRQITGSLVIVESSPPNSTLPESYVVDTSLSECLIGVWASDGSVYSYHDLAAEAAMGARSLGARRHFESVEDTLPSALKMLSAMGLGTGWHLDDWETPGSGGKRDPKAERIVLRLGERVPGFEGFTNMCVVEVDLVAGVVYSAGGTREWRFAPPLHTLTREEAVGALRTAWGAEAPHYEQAGLERLPWPGDEQCRTEAKMYAYPPVGARSFTSRYGEQLERDRTVRVCWVFGSGRFSVAVDAEDGRVVRSDLSKQATRRPRWREPGFEQVIARDRENLRRYADQRRVAALQFWGAFLLILAAIVGLFLWHRHTNKSVLD